MQQKSAEVYTDGAFLCYEENGRIVVKAGVGVFWGINHPNNISARLNGLIAEQISTSPEIAAAIIALRQAAKQKYYKITICTDSQALIDFDKKHLKWKENGWLKDNGDPLVHAEDYKRLLRVKNRIPKVHFRKVVAHSNNFGNDQADELATAGREKNCMKCSEYDYDSVLGEMKKEVLCVRNISALFRKNSKCFEYYPNIPIGTLLDKVDDAVECFYIEEEDSIIFIIGPVDSFKNADYYYTYDIVAEKLKMTKQSRPADMIWFQLLYL